MGGYASSNCAACEEYGQDEDCNSYVMDAFASCLVPWKLDVGPVKINFTKVEFTEREGATINLRDFLIRDLSMTGIIHADVNAAGESHESCMCRPLKFDCAGDRLGSMGWSGSGSKFTVRVIVNLTNAPGAELKAEIVDINVIRCPVDLNKILPQDRLTVKEADHRTANSLLVRLFWLNAAFVSRLADHVNMKIEECVNQNKVQLLTIGDDSAYPAFLAADEASNGLGGR